ncbi:hypothetical protein GCM10022288_27740 [Gryllotalpicola kribbensis]|uniref:Uncharacterized protein n=1 Tax=Gryllotalpicola kribbensis TaxID=993084 RepID=A0ABP8AZ43_9MICO
MAFIGGILGVLPAAIIIAAESLSDPDLFGVRGTATDPYPSDASALGGILIAAIPVCFALGAVAACASYGLGVAISQRANLWLAAFIGALLTGPFAWVGVAAFSRLTSPPAFVTPLVAVLSVVCAFGLGRVLLGARRHSES